MDKPIEAEHEEIIADLNLDELAYGPPGFKGIFSSSYVALCAAFAAIGGLLFGYECVMSHALDVWFVAVRR
jgi:hypothetical protein